MPILPTTVESTDAPASSATSYTITVNQTAQGVLSSNGDHDWYRVTLTAGVTYQFAMVGTGVNNVTDPYLTLRNSAGSQVAVNDDGGPGNSSWITYTPSSTG